MVVVDVALLASAVAITLAAAAAAPASTLAGVAWELVVVDNEVPLSMRRIES
ncbi:hypothetical protein CP061683_0458A, partial [Chlamydia psittaci 06-1683]